MTHESPELDVDFTVQAVENLVTQFSSALDFYRELVQNSIDAGTSAVEVWLEFIPGAEDAGTIAIHVDDDGEGMNEAIIDNQLTRLFASGKTGDLTKIGKFGIGFVSVFAPGPQAVLLHTGRGGEAWEICFDADRSFIKTRLDTPVEGTQITLFLAGDRSRYRELVAGSRTTLQRWCVHSDVEIYFEDRSFGTGPEQINQRFEVPGVCLTYTSAEGTEAVLAYDSNPSYGFYNKGLALTTSTDAPALLGEHAPRLAHIGFKVKSRYLEHTLSRDTVVREGNYFKAIELILAAVDGPLQAALVDQLTTLVAQTGWSIAELQHYRQLLQFLGREPDTALSRHENLPLLRLVDGRSASLESLWSAASEDFHVFCSDAIGPLEHQLLASGTPILLGAPAHDASEVSDFGPAAALVARYVSLRHRRSLRGRLGALGIPASLSGRNGRHDPLVITPNKAFLHVQIVEPTADEAQLLRTASALLAKIGAGYRRLALCVLDHDGPLFVLGRTLAPRMQRPPEGQLFLERRPRRPEAAVHRAHPLFRRWLFLQQTAPAMAAYCLAKDLLLLEDRLLGRDIALMAAARPEVFVQFGGRS